MATPPDAIRTDLALISAAVAADVQQVAASAEAGGVTAVRSALFAAAPLIVGDYIDGAAALAFDWYTELREEAGVTKPHALRLVTSVDADRIAALTADATSALRREVDDIAQAMQGSIDHLASSLLAEVMDGFRETVTENAAEDPEAAGWKRFAQPGACKFCKMLADRGAVYRRETARFAAHGAFVGGKRTGGDCMCIAGPAFGGKDEWAEATPMQYVASQRRRTAKQRADLRAYLNKNYPDARG